MPLVARNNRNHDIPSEPPARLALRFGVALDGAQGIDPRPRINAMTGGMQVLLGQLELRLGLPALMVSHARRVIEFRDALAKASKAGTEGRFYERSFEKDPLAVAETLLLWRDELVLAGWLGKPAADGRTRLNDLAAVEACAAERVRTGVGDRIRRIQGALDAGAAVPIAVSVLDHRAHLPQLLVQLLDRMGADFEAPAEFPLAAEGTNLRQAQEALLGRRETITWNKDGDESLVLCIAFSEFTLAQAAAHWISTTPPNARGDNVPVLLATASMAPIAAALRGRNAPLPATRQASVERPILQLLRLALRLRWQPLNPQHLLEFLVHPVNPLPGFLRQRLAEAVANQPGVGGQAWQEAIAKAQQAAEKWQKEEGGNAAATIEGKLHDWLVIDRFDSRTGAPGRTLIETGERVRSWALARSGAEPDELQAAQWRQLAEQALELTDLLSRYDTVKATELDRLLMLIEGGGAERGECAELGSIRCLKNPGAVLEPVADLLWWCAEASPRAAEAPWTRAERQSLKQCGVHLLSLEKLIEAQHAAALRPLLAAQQRVRLFLPRQRGGEAVEHHPLLDELQARAGTAVPIVDVDAVIAASDLSLGGHRHARRLLAKPRRWWKLGNPTLLRRCYVESFSSLQSFVFQPFASVLQYCAGIQSGAVGSFSVQADVRQRGNLMHRVVEKLFDPQGQLAWQSAPATAFDAWLEETWQGLLLTEAANFLLPGMQSDAERLKLETREAVWRLIQHLRTAGVEHAEADVRPSRAAFKNGAQIGGRVDLVVRRPGVPSRMVIDLKYAGRDKRQQELANNAALQLAVYCYLLASGDGGEWPDAAYFILSKGLLLAQNTAFFPDAREVSPNNGSGGPQACWNDFLRVWEWRQKQFEEGWIEVPVAGTLPTDGSNGEPDSAPPDDRWAPDPEATRYDGFEALTGWEEDA